jgi:hypothetical protein
MTLLVITAFHRLHSNPIPASLEETVKHLSLLSLALFTLSIAGALADETNPTLTQERAYKLGAALFKTKRVGSVSSAAIKSEGITSEETSQARPMVTSVDCKKNPESYGTVDPSFCALRGVVSFGWYADPTLILRAVGYIKKDKIAAGLLNESDFIVTNVIASTPLRTGLE